MNISYKYMYFMQSDLLREIRLPFWDDEKAIFNKTYHDALIISNTCDISIENKHELNTKQCLFAPVVELNEYIDDLRKSEYSEKKLEQFINTIKAQMITNLFYLPFLYKEQKEYIVMFDNLFWFPTNELNSYTEKIEQNRITSLSHFGHYLFILKLSYHLCRLPEEQDR